MSSKRIADLVMATCGLALLLPVFLVIAVLVVMCDGRPVLFKQLRVGREGKVFRLLKFRTMALRRDGEGGSFDAGDGSRVTRVGKILRKSKLDELPQLWNVIWGSMSIVGPRPEVPEWTAVYPERWARVHAVRPGITDPASIAFRHEERLLAAAEDPTRAYRDEILPRKLDLYEDYVEHQSFWGDILLILRTLSTVLTR